MLIFVIPKQRLITADPYQGVQVDVIIRHKYVCERMMQHIMLVMPVLAHNANEIAAIRQKLIDPWVFRERSMGCPVHNDKTNVRNDLIPQYASAYENDRRRS